MTLLTRLWLELNWCARCSRRWFYTRSFSYSLLRIFNTFFSFYFVFVLAKTEMYTNENIWKLLETKKHTWIEPNRTAGNICIASCCANRENEEKHTERTRAHSHSLASTHTFSGKNAQAVECAHTQFIVVECFRLYCICNEPNEWNFVTAFGSTQWDTMNENDRIASKTTTHNLVIHALNWR